MTITNSAGLNGALGVAGDRHRLNDEPEDEAKVPSVNRRRSAGSIGQVGIAFSSAYLAAIRSGPAHVQSARREQHNRAGTIVSP